MTLRLALVIDGDAKGARQALDETARGVEDLGKKAVKTSGDLDKVTARDTKKPIEWAPVNEELDKLSRKAPPAADALGKVGAGLGDTGRAAPGAATGLGDVGKAAGGAADHLGRFRGATVGLLAGLAGGVVGAAVAAGLGIATEAFVSYAREVFDNTPRINRDLKEHTELIRRIKGAYDEARGGASSYGLESSSLLRFQAQQDIGRLEKDVELAIGDFNGRDLFGPLALQNGLERFLEDFGAVGEAVLKLRRQLADGKADLIAFRNEIGKAAEELPVGSPLRQTAERLIADTEQAAKLQAELARAKDLLKGLTGDAEAAATALGGSAEKYRDIGGSAAAANAPIAGVSGEIAASGDAAGAANAQLAEYERLLRSISGLSVQPALPAGPGGLPAGGFAAGGYTGHLPADRVAGFVHGREFVFDAASTARIGVANLEAMRAGISGYASGGFVGNSAAYARRGGAGGSAAELAEEFGALQGIMHQFGMTVWRAGSAGEALGGVIQMVSQRFLDFSLRALDQALFGGRGGGLGMLGDLFGLNALNMFPAAPGALGVGLYHGGGPVGAAPGPTRRVPPSLFVGAPRLHGGGWLKPGERPVIAMDGEEIGWPEDLQRKYGGGRTVVNNWHVETPNPKAFAESRALAARAAGRLAARSGRYS